MPYLTFLGVENPLGVLGPKIQDVLVDRKSLQPIMHVSKDTPDATRYAVQTKHKYKYRAANLPEKVPKLMVEDTIDNREYVLKLLVKLLEKKKYPNLRVAMCSSLRSMLKYLAKYVVQHQGDKVETVIIYGHGSEGSINMGLGKIGIGPPLPHTHKDHAARKAIREAFGLDKPTSGDKPEPRRIRDLSTENTDVWTDAFGTIKEHLESSTTGYFHLFLMGCSVGEREEGHNTTLQGAAAQALSDIIKQNVCISAPTKTITNDHLDYLLDHIEEIRRDCANDDQVFLTVQDDPPVPLASAKAEMSD